MTGTQLSWGAPEWLLPAVLLGCLFMALIIWSYRGSRSVTRRQLLAAVLKMAAVWLLVICLMEPLISRVRPQPGANLFAVLVDNSRSMQIAERGLPAGDQLRDWLGPDDGGWRARLDQDFEMRLYCFDHNVRKLDAPHELNWQGDQSHLISSLRALRQRLGARPIAGILLVTDGNATEVTDALDGQSWPPAPLYPVVPHRSDTLTDVRLSDISVNQTLFESSPSTIDAKLVASQMDGRPVRVDLVDSDGEVVESQTASLLPDGEPTPIRFAFRPEMPGLSFYQLSVTPTQSGRGAVAEATLENNTKTVKVDRGGGPFRVLYIAGRPNWEFKFLRRALDHDEEVQLVGLIRIAKEEPKFQFRDQAGTAKNPLFEGFDETAAEEAEQYDQPVLVRIGVESSQELVTGFPKSAKELYRYDAVVIDDLEASFFSPDQMLLLRRYVGQRGGGLLMIGGVSTFSQGGYAKTPVGEMLPVYLDGESAPAGPGPFKMSLTRDGLLEPWVRLRDTAAAEQKRLQEWPQFQTLNQVGQIKPGAIGLAEANAAAGQAPAFVVQRFGKGRTAALLLGDVWRASMRRQSAQDDLATFWRQVTRWLVSDVPRRVEVNVAARPTGAQPVRIQVQVVDAEYHADDDASVQLTVRPPHGDPITIATESGDTSGVYEAEYLPFEPGGYRVETKVVGGDGKALPPNTAGWIWSPRESEFERLAVNTEQLTQLARATGGETVPLDQIDRFVQTLDKRPVPVTELSVTPFWHQSWVFATALLCLCAEWGIRRWTGLT